MHDGGVQMRGEIRIILSSIFMLMLALPAKSYGIDQKSIDVMTQLADSGYMIALIPTEKIEGLKPVCHVTSPIAEELIREYSRETCGGVSDKKITCAMERVVKAIPDFIDQYFGNKDGRVDQEELKKFKIEAAVNNGLFFLCCVIAQNTKEAK